MKPEFFMRLRLLLTRRKPADLDDELQFHIEQSTQAQHRYTVCRQTKPAGRR